MLIVSQDGNKVVNLDTAGTIEVSEKFGILVDELLVIAQYESEPAAKNALRQLWSDYASGKKVFIMP